MADNREQQWAARLREGRTNGLSSVDARLASAPRTNTATLDDEEGPLDDVAADRETAARSTQQRQESLRARNVAQRVQSRSAQDEEESDFSPPQLQVAAQAVDTAKAVGGPVAEAAIKKAQGQFRWWMWGLALETFGLSLLVLDILYIGQKYFPSLRRFVPKPYLAEIIALIVLTTLLMMALGLILTVQFLPIFLLTGIPGLGWLIGKFL